MTPQARAPQMSPVEIRQAVAKHTFDCAKCKAMDCICSKGCCLRRTLGAGEQSPERRVKAAGDE
ncbi:hypothetical protein GKQ77_17445 [Streptomyces sp. BG9H]|uniref:Uncharacterized protein n=1 Tax=Streptomyces anatolicus TaxID=2675858 RepID=A0ABS6YPK2_9ACTN|nr:hypothetical protein [Streptomyces anatolicus]MBW5423328.1 hypothetical protein [Streptomyces anatolicus]